MRSAWFAAALMIGSAAAAPAWAHEFVVYFAYDSVEFAAGPRLPGRAHYENVVKDVACLARTPDLVELTISAHTDTAGPADYNADLSLRRGRRLRDMLVRLGVDPTKIVVRAAGEAQPAVATGDGAREPLNRRATFDNRVAGGAARPQCEPLSHRPLVPGP
jgi:outer membrane protein OmpA-like peptidoglycan-associated protein